LISLNRYEELAETLARFYDDPLGYVMWAFPWGQGPLAGFDGPRKWQREFLLDLGRAIKERNFDGLKPVDPIQIARASGHGIGKLHDVDLVIDTPQGRRRWGDLRPGDLVFAGNGEPTRINKCKFYENAPSYRVTFDDGAYCDVSSGHLWSVKGRKERRKGVYSWRTLETIELHNLGAKRSNGKSRARQWEIPNQGAAQFPEAPVLLDPYIVGLWLGDGTRMSPRITKPYPEIFKKVRGIHKDTTWSDSATFTLRGLGPLFNDGVFTKHSYDRYIPEVYKYNSIENREALLEGLLDSDGEVHGSGSIGFSSTSKQLALDVLWLVRSLGGRAKVQAKIKKGRYKGDDGALIDCRDSYRLTINLKWNPFTVRHKKEKYKIEKQARYLKRWIDKIEEIPSIKKGMCIEVDNADGLYLANDFIVTHNSALSAMLIKFVLDTRPYSKGVVTANTGDQLKTKTWAELGKWHNLSVTRDLFEYTSTKGNMTIKSVFAPESWRCDAMTCREENSEAFAGLHAATSTPFYLFDESSAVPDKIFEVAQGGLTDGEPMFFLFGNPTRNTGFFRNVFGRLAHRWQTKKIDSRGVEGTNKKLLDDWINDYGIDSDFVKVRVRGIFPSASVTQLIPTDLVEAAMIKELRPDQFEFAPRVLGIDVAWYGDDRNVIYYRQGLSAVKLWEGREVSSVTIAGMVARFINDYNIDATFIDAGMGNGVIDQLRALGYSPIPVYFGEASTSAAYKNKRAQMWGDMRDWLKEGPSIPDDSELLEDLTAPEYFMTLKGEIQLERKEDMKKRGLSSPDQGDALALTFAEPVYVDPYVKKLRTLGTDTKQDRVKTEYKLFP